MLDRHGFKTLRKYAVDLRAPAMGAAARGTKFLGLQSDLLSGLEGDMQLFAVAGWVRNR